MKIIGYQFQGSENVAQNILAARISAEYAAKMGADLLCLPEAAMYLRPDESKPLLSETIEAKNTFTQELLKISAEYKIAIMAGIFETAKSDKSFNKAYNTVIVVNDNKIIAKYQKLHLYDAFLNLESKYIEKGDNLPPVFELCGVKVGIMTCYDLRFPEVARSLAINGADIILTPSAWFAGENKIHHWRTLCAARAIENATYIMGVNMCGADIKRTGHSCFISPQGEIISELSDNVDYISGEVDLSLLKKVRRKMPVLNQMRFKLDLKNDEIIKKIAEKLINSDSKLCTAESCTGGLIAANLTGVAGSSAWFDRSFITYSNQAKIQMLNVSKDTIENHGAVSEQTVREMAKGAVNNSNANISIAITGIAGPSGGSDKKPLGTVWIAWQINGKIYTQHNIFSGNRDLVCSQSVRAALIGLLKKL